MKKPGPKGYGEELHIKQRYAALSEEFFIFLKDMFENGDKIDKKWASEQMSKAFVKMIPQSIEGGDSNKPIILKFDGEFKK